MEPFQPWPDTYRGRQTTAYARGPRRAIQPSVPDVSKA